MKAFAHEKKGLRGPGAPKGQAAAFREKGHPWTSKSQRSTDPDFAELEDLIEESNEIAAAKKKLAENAKMPEEDRAKMRATVAAWEAKREWETLEKVAVFTHCQCNHCGSRGDVFSHWMLKQKSRLLHSARRTTRVTDKVLEETASMSKDLPISVLWQVMNTPMCAECAHAFGVDLTGGGERVSVPVAEVPVGPKPASGNAVPAAREASAPAPGTMRLGDLDDAELADIGALQV